MTHFKSYPFTAIVGQDEMKLALILNAINPSIGGVLIRGEKGTAKSTAARSLADLLPKIEIIKDCKFNCNPNDPKECCHSCQHALEDGLINADKIEVRKMRVVNLPINASEDRVIGTIDIKKVLQDGIKALETGILAEANRNILYIDEVNLLADNIADLLLDAAAMGINIIEREGISTHHPAKFILIGTMNPEEGNLRPQLLDRFGLSVKVAGIKNLDQRIRIMDYVEQYHQDPVAFYEKFAAEQEQLRERINQARNILKNVGIDPNLVKKISEISLKLGIDSHRADITILRTAKSLAAFNGSSTVSKNDIKIAVKLALEHRLKKKPFEEKELNMDLVEQILNSELKDQNDNQNEEKRTEEQKKEQENSEIQEQDNNNMNESKTMNNRRDNLKITDENSDKKENELKTFGIKQGMIAPTIHEKKSQNHNPHNEYPSVTGKRIPQTTLKKTGKVIGYSEFNKLRHSNINDIAILPTINSAATLNQISCNSDSNSQLSENKITINEQNIKINRRQGKQSYSLIFCVDASGSMGVQKRMEEVKGLVMSVLQMNYIFRDKVSLVVFRENKAEVILEPTRSVDLAKKHLETIPTGGNTTLLLGLTRAYELAKYEKESNSGYIPLIMLISDGRTSMDSETTIEEIIKISDLIARLQIELIVVDTEDPNCVVGVSQMVAEQTGAVYYHIDSLNQENMKEILKREHLWGAS